MLKNLLSYKGQSIHEAWKKINENAKGFVFVLDQSDKIAGVLTDGDIRRFMLSGGSISEGVEKVIKENFIYAKKDETPEEIFSKLSSKIKVIPIVDADFKLVDYAEYKSDLKIPVAQPDLIGNELKYLTDALLSTWISSSGHYLNRFQDEFASYCGMKHGLAVSNGTVALQLALLTLGVGEGDEVIIPDLTFAATINAVLYTGAKPVLVDVKEDSWCIDPNEIEKAVTPKTKAIIPVHLYGQPADMDPIMDIAVKNDIYIVEDCAEAHGAEYKGRKVGSFGDINCFSFFGNKVITTGEGGMCLTNNEVFLETMKTLKNHGMSKNKKYWHDTIGYNFRMTNLQAAVGVAQLERIENILKEKQNIEDNYKKALSGNNHILFQPELLDRKKIIWLVTAIVDGNRDALIDVMQKNGIDARPMFYPLSEMPIYEEYTFSNSVSKKISAKGISFPTNKAVNAQVFRKVKETCNEFYKI